MTDAFLILLGAVAGGIVTAPVARHRYAERLRRAARNVPGESLAIATLERVARDQDRR